jgi:hypothetical protein
MIKSIVIHDIPSAHIAAMERRYFRDHAPEIIRRYGPWLARRESYLPVPVPEDARSYGFYNWRITEGWWRESPFKKGQMGHGSALSEVWCDNYNKACGLPEGEAARTEKWKAKAPAFIYGWSFSAGLGNVV